MTPEQLAQLFHETYERLAPEHGYETRKASAVPWADVPANNKALMIAVAEHVLKRAEITLYARLVEQHMAERQAEIEQEVRAKVAEELRADADAHRRLVARKPSEHDKARLARAMTLEDAAARIARGGQ
jgi:hypothetical protein